MANNFPAINEANISEHTYLHVVNCNPILRRNYEPNQARDNIASS